MRSHLLIQNICCVLIFFASAQGVAEVTTGGSVPAPVPFVEVVSKANAKLKELLDTQIIALAKLMSTAGLSSSTNLLIEIKKDSTNYFISKNACASAADTAEMLCIESKSTQAIKAKGIVDAGGLALASSTSAQKTCSSTASFTDMAQKAMVLAKGACVGSKLICDNACTKAALELETLSAKTAKFIADATVEVTAALADCLAEAPCVARYKNVEIKLGQFGSVVPSALAAEAPPLPPGTTGSIALRCQGYAKDVVLFGMNILGLFQANKSAAECAEKLAAGSTSPTKEEYCKIPANSATSFCKCQKDTTAEGCPGQKVPTSTAANSADGKGNDIKSAGGTNQFAGGFENVKAVPIDLGKLKSDLANPTTDDTKAGGAAGMNAFGSAPSGSSGGGSAGGSSGKASDAKDAVAGDDKKKMGLGSFFGTGGGSSSGSGSGKEGYGSLGQKDMDAIQRQIASEKLRAEVSGASGKSNWEKVSERYLRNKSTLLVGQ